MLLFLIKSFRAYSLYKQKNLNNIIKNIVSSQAIKLLGSTHQLKYQFTSLKTNIQERTTYKNKTNLQKYTTYYKGTKPKNTECKTRE